MYSKRKLQELTDKFLSDYLELSYNIDKEYDTDSIRDDLDSFHNRLANSICESDIAQKLDLDTGFLLDMSGFAINITYGVIKNKLNHIVSDITLAVKNFFDQNLDDSDYVILNIVTDYKLPLEKYIKVSDDPCNFYEDNIKNFRLCVVNKNSVERLYVTCELRNKKIKSIIFNDPHHKLLLKIKIDLDEDNIDNETGNLISPLEVDFISLQSIGLIESALKVIYYVADLNKK